MTEVVEEPQYTTLAERIAALNKQKNFQSPPSGSGKRPPPPPPPPPQQSSSSSSSPSWSSRPAPPPRPGSRLDVSPNKVASGPPKLPHRTTSEDKSSPPLPNRSLAPPLPARRPSSQQSPLASPLSSSAASQTTSPALPPRANSSYSQRPSGRRNSNESDVSYISTISNLSLGQSDHQHQVGGGGGGGGGRRLPPTLDQANLPPLPPSRRDLDARANGAAANGSTNPHASLRSKTPISEPPRPSLPPRLPSRPTNSPQTRPFASANRAADNVAAAVVPRRLPPVPSSYDPPTPRRPKAAPAVALDERDVPPPVPIASRPTDQQIEAAVAGRTLQAAQVPDCLICRDFSAVDALAARYPLHALPRHNVAEYLARALCDPFPSLTDKARAVFTWCHHNIRYDVEGFFGNCIPRGLTPDQTILSGKAVCEGYAKVYQSIAQRGGLECVVVTGHGKGYGFTEVAPGAAPPRRDPTGHAWNAVRLDDGQWKLLDACWGAGHLGEGQTYNKKFSPLQFSSSNEVFGLSHYPSDPRHFYRHDGRTPTWEEYVLGPVRGPKAQWYNDAADEGLAESTLSPAAKHIPAHGGDDGDHVRFQVGKVCEHWNNEVHGPGKPRLLILKINGGSGGGGGDDMLPLDNDGFWWWIDVPRRDLGRPGQTVSLFALNTLGEASGRGVTKEKFLASKGRVGMSWVGISAWELI